MDLGIQNKHTLKFFVLSQPLLIFQISTSATYPTKHNSPPWKLTDDGAQATITAYLRDPEKVDGQKGEHECVKASLLPYFCSWFFLNKDFVKLYYLIILYLRWHTQDNHWPELSRSSCVYFIPSDYECDIPYMPSILYYNFIG